MSDNLVLAISRHPSTIEAIREALAFLGEGQLEFVDRLKDSTIARDAGRPRLFVVHLEGLSQAPRIVRWLRRMAAQPASPPVVVVSETYNVERAIELFQSGAADYLSLADHLEHLAVVIRTLTERSPFQGKAGREDQVRRGPERPKAVGRRV